MVRALGYRFQRILICSAQYGRKSYRHHRIGIALESRVAAMGLEIRCLLAAELSAELSAMMLAELSVLLLVNPLVVIPQDFEQPPVSNMLCSLLSGRYITP